jgi:hypothetical protein
VRFGDLSAAELITSSDPFGDYILHFDQSLLEDQFAVTFTNGSSVSSAFDIRIVGDNLREGMEFFQIEIINITVEGQLPGVELQPGPNSVVLVSIVDDDVLQVKFKEGSVSVNEGDSVVIHGQTSGAPFSSPIDIGVICFPLRAQGTKSATFGLDYNYTSLLQLEFSDVGQTAVMSSSGPTILALEDGCVEGMESFICAMQVGVSPGDTIRSMNPDTVTVKIIDEDQLMIQWQRPNDRVLESAGVVVVQLMAVGKFQLSFTLLGTARQAVSSVVGGRSFKLAIPSTGSFTGDYRDLDATFSYSSSCTDMMISVSSVFFIEDDDVLEEDEVFELIFTIPTLLSQQINIKSGDTVNMSIIIEDDDYVSVGFGNTSCIGSEALGVASFNIEVTGKYYIDFQVEVECRSGSALAGQDFVMFRKFLNVTRSSITTEPFAELLPNITTTPPFLVEILNDSLLEPDECFVCQILSTTHQRVLIGSKNTTNCCVTDEDIVTVQFSKAFVSVPESIGVMQFELELIGSTAVNITVEVATLNPLPPSLGQPATGGLDYRVTMSLLTFPPTRGRGSMTFSVQLIDDQIPEGAEYFSVRINSVMTTHPRVVIGNPSTGVGQILDDDDFVTIGLESPTYNVSEDAQKVDVCVSLSNSYFEPITVTLIPQVISGSPIDVASVADLDLSSVSVTLGPGTTRFCSPITIIDEPLVEYDEDFTVTLTYTNVQAGVSLSGQNQTTITILNDDRVKLSFQPSSQMTSEGNVVEVTVVASARASFDYSFTVFSVDGSAIATQDYERVNLTFTYTGGSPFLTYPFNISIYNDSVFEESEDFQLQLTINEVSAARGIEPGTPDVSMVIIDADAGLVVASSGVEVSFHPINYTVGEGDNVTIVIVTNVTVDVPITVSVTFGGGSASEPNDYISGEMFATVVIPAGERMATLVIMTIADNLLEGSENFFGILNTSGAPNVVIGNVSMAMVIIEDQTNVVVSFLSEQASVREGHPGALILLLEGGVQLGEGFTFFVNIVPRNGTATAPDDFSPAVIPVHFVGGSNAATFVVSAKVDSLVEGREHFFLDIMIPLVASDLGVSVGSRPTATVTVDDGDATTVVFSSDDFSVGEGDGQICVGINASLPNTRAYTLHLEVNSGTALNGADFGPVISPMLVEVAALEVDARVCVPILVDAVLEGEEYFTITLVVPSEAAGAGVSRGTPHIATIRVLDDDGIKVSLSTDKVDMMEGTDRTISVDVDGEFDVPFTITLIAVPISAGPSDYGDSFPLTITFNPGNTSVEVLLSSVSDGIIECEERYIVMLNTTPTISALGVSLGDFPQTEVIIEDNDRPLEVIFQPLEYTVIEGRIVNITMVTSTSVYSFPFSVSLMFMDMTASGGSDYVPQPVTVAFSPGQEEVSFEVMTVEDNIAEISESFKIVITGTNQSELVRIGMDNIAIIEIVDNDEPVDISITTENVTEGSGYVTVCVVKSSESFYPVRVTIRPEQIMSGVIKSEGGDLLIAEAGIDFDDAEVTVELSSGSTRECVNVTVTDDSIVECDEMFNVTMVIADGQNRSAVVSFRLAEAESVVTIIDDDSLFVMFEEPMYMIREGEGPLMINLITTGTASFNFSININTLPPVPMGRNAIAGLDYTFNVSSVSFGSGEDRSKITVTVLEDEVFESIETFSLALSVPDSYRLKDIFEGDLNVTLVMIKDNDVATVIFSPAFYNATEGEKVEICLRVDREIEQPFTAIVNTVNGTAVESLDYFGGVYFVEFMPGRMTSCFFIRIMNDTIIETQEEFTLVITTIGPTDVGVVIGDPDVAVVTIYDGTVEVPVRFEEELYNVTEGQDDVASVALVTDVNHSFDFTVSVAITDGTAKRDEDYDASMMVDVFFPAGTNRVVLPINIVNDNISELVEEFHLDLIIPEGAASSGVVAMEPNMTTVVINDDDDVVVTFELQNYTIKENEGPLTVKVTASKPTSYPYNITITPRSDTAVANEDFDPTPITITINPGETMASFTVGIADDNIVEPGEVFHLDITISGDDVDGMVTAGGSSTVTIIDNDVVVSFSKTVYRFKETVINGVIKLNASGDLSQPFTVGGVFTDGTAVEGMDYSGKTFEVKFDVGVTMLSLNVRIIADKVANETEEVFTATITGVDTTRVSIGEPSSTSIFIVDVVDPAGGGVRNDSVVGDPLYTIPLRQYPESIRPEFKGEVVSLCYEFAGTSGQYYSLISDRCTFANAHYAAAAADPSIHIMSEIGIRTEGANLSCHDVRVRLEGCQVLLDGQPFTGTFRANGIILMTNRRRARIETDNCAPSRRLVMWVSCDQTGDIDMLHFTVSRGEAIDPTGHGLIGQFWNIPVDITPYSGPYGEENVTEADQIYDINFRPPGKPQRSILAELGSNTWDNRKKPCLFAGDSYGGPIWEAPPEYGSVIEGDEDSYEVDSLFDHEFEYSQFVVQC